MTMTMTLKPVKGQEHCLEILDYKRPQSVEDNYSCRTRFCHNQEVILEG